MVKWSPWIEQVVFEEFFQGLCCRICTLNFRVDRWDLQDRDAVSDAEKRPQGTRADVLISFENSTRIDRI